MVVDSECPGNRRKVEVVCSAVFSESSQGSCSLHSQSELMSLQIVFLGVIKSFHVQKVGRSPSDALKMNGSFHLLLKCQNCQVLSITSFS